MDIYCLDQLSVYWNARRILNIDWEKSGEQKEKRNLKHNEKFEWKNLKYYTIKTEHNRDYYLYDPICSK